MRVMILTADYPPHVWSGIGATVERQASALAARGIEVHVMVAARLGAPVSPAAENDPVVHHLCRRRCPVDPWSFDVVHLHSLALSEFAVEMRRRAGTRLVYTAHSLLHLELADAPHAAGWCAVQQHMLATSDRVVFLSVAERAAALDLFPELAGRSVVIPNGVPPPPRALPPPGGDGPIVFAGRFTRNKGVELLAAVIPRLLARRQHRFVLAGGHGDERGHRVLSSVSDRFPGHCQLVGWLGRDELDRLLASAAVVLVPSLYEPFGLVALEAMRNGAPVLAAAVGGLAEIVDRHSGGRLVHSRDPEAWTDAIVDLLTDPATTQALHLRGPEYVAARYDVDRLAQRLVDDVYAA